jgi:curved DNA-binding protein CbpA
MNAAPPVKTHYELLGLEPSADAESIKKAFRREIARYHPDKVIHLGAEFQELASTRAAELTIAYKTLSDPALREEYDAGIAAGRPLHAPSSPGPQPDGAASPPPSADHHAPPPENTARFASERADRDLILKRAVASRVLGIVETLYGKADTPATRGFDAAIVPQAKPRFLGAPPPRVLIRIVERADGPAIADAFASAARARVHQGKSPVVVLVCSRQFASPQDIARAHDANARQRKGPGAPEEVAVVLVDIGDWTCRLPPNPSAAVQKLAEQICA